jgi:hypothetical protein
MCSKLLRNGRGTRRLVFASLQKATRESYRASQRGSRRRPFPVFEQGNSDGTKIVTIKILFRGFPKSPPRDC